MIEAHGLTKRYGAKTAVDRLTFAVQPGIVTGFLGPNGSGKSTTMRMILGLDAPSDGLATVAGVPFRQLTHPARTVGALLDAKSLHPGRSARANLLSLARMSGIPSRRVDEVLGLVGLQDVAGRRTGGFSLGMGQRLGIAAALLGDPQVLMLDEPVNGLDPEGVLWIRQLIRGWAAEGRTVFVSSHLMSEMALTADHLVIIGQGKLLADMSLTAFVNQYSTGHVAVRCVPEDTPRLVPALAAAGGSAQQQPDGALRVTGLDAQRISELAHAQGIRLLELAPQQASLEEAYMRMTQHAVEYRAAAPMPGAPMPGAGMTATPPPVAYAPQPQAPAGQPGYGAQPLPPQAPAGQPGYAPQPQAPAGQPGYGAQPVPPQPQAPAGQPGYGALPGYQSGQPGYGAQPAPPQAPAAQPGYGTQPAPPQAPAAQPGYGAQPVPPQPAAYPPPPQAGGAYGYPPAPQPAHPQPQPPAPANPYAPYATPKSEG
ncbi:ABC-2 type transport system ATP-binding protein [Streptacidiphilus sp. MAP12-33]|uniref:ABC transporter ATP-binding protein n=1 Tax=Streptacidiphilus sp. MAP12-33 TaxID=3156266 RepID=UPI00351630C2